MLNKVTKLISFILILCFIFSLTGCSFRFSNFDSLIRPPKATGKYQGLSDAFEKEVGTGYVLCTPEKGDYQSSYILYDCDGDNDEDAIVFYSDNESDVVRFLYLEYNDKSWTPTKCFKGMGNGIDRVLFPDIDDDGKPEIIIGWSYLSGKIGNVFSLYDVDDSIKQIGSSSYSDMTIVDINGDGVDEILTFLIDTSSPDNLITTVKAYKMNNVSKTIEVLGETKADGNISAYTSIKSEKKNGVNYVYCESNKGESDSITELIYWDDTNNNLSNPLFDVTSQTAKDTWRNIRIASFDIDSDGFMEIPTSVVMNGSQFISNNSSESEVDSSVVKPMYFIKWVKYMNGKLKPVQYSIADDKSGFIFNIPSSWVGRITVVRSDDQLNVYRWTGSSSGDLLFTICSYGVNNTESSKLYESYTRITNDSKVVFAYIITESGYKFGVSDKALKEDFKLFTFGS